MPASRLQVQGFLSKLSKVNPAAIVLARQRKTLDFLDLIDYDSSDVVRELMQLTVEDYSYGPNTNDWGVGDVWHFGKEVPEYKGETVVAYHRVYIKICLTVSKDGSTTTCMSFHPPGQDMTFPHKKPPARWSVQ